MMGNKYSAVIFRFGSDTHRDAVTLLEEEEKEADIENTLQFQENNRYYQQNLEIFYLNFLTSGRQNEVFYIYLQMEKIPSRRVK